MTKSAEAAAKLKVDLAKVLGGSPGSAELDFLVSSLTEHNPDYSTEEVAEWLRETGRRSQFQVEQIPLEEVRGWGFDANTGDLAHTSGGFFRIRGVSVDIDDGQGRPRSWSQPIIDQPEVGVLGFLVREIDGVLYFLTQAKLEPGNLDAFLLTPTVTATRSNFMRLHGGKPIPYLEHFLDAEPRRVLVDQLQSEQCARFFRKRNRNMIVRVPADTPIELLRGFRWLTLGQLRRLARMDNTVNMTARSVMAMVPWNASDGSKRPDPRALDDCLSDSALVSDFFDRGAEITRILSSQSNAAALHDDSSVAHRLTREQFTRAIRSELVPLRSLPDWELRDGRIVHAERLHFSVLGLRIAAESREVASWDQPVIEQPERGLVGFLGREVEGILHLLVQLKSECGSRDHLDLAPTVQYLPGSYGDQPPSFAGDLAASGGTELDVLQLEEGARFCREENRNVFLRRDHGDPEQEGGDHIWVNLRQLKRWLATSDAVNVEARSVLSML